MCRLWPWPRQRRARSSAARGARASVELRPGLELGADRDAVADPLTHARAAAQPGTQGPGARVIDLLSALPHACRAVVFFLVCLIHCVQFQFLLIQVQTKFMIYESENIVATGTGTGRDCSFFSLKLTQKIAVTRKTCLQV